MREQFGDIMRVLLNTAPHDKAVRESLAKYHGALGSAREARPAL
jgi:hypothetical protein